MRKTLKSLFMINLLYVNPQVTKQYRDKYKGSVSIPKKVFNQILFPSILLFCFLAYSFFQFDLKTNPGLYKYTVLGCFLYSFLVISLSVINVLYESRDTISLLSLPIDEKELFLSKTLITVFYNISPWAILTLFNFIMAISSDAMTVTKFLTVIVFTIVEITTLIGIILFIVCSFTKMKNFVKHKKKIILAIGVLIFLIAPPMLIIIPIKDKNKTHSDFLSDVLIKENTKETFLILFGLIIFSTILLFLINKLFIKTYYTTLYRLENKDFLTLTKKRLKKSTKKTKLKTKLIKLNVKLFSNSTLLFSLFYGWMLMFGMSGTFRLFQTGPNIDDKFYPLMIISGLIFAILTSIMPSFSAVSLSLEKENYYALKALPMSFKKYLRLKLMIAQGYELILNIPVIIGIAIFLKLKLILTLTLISSFIISKVALSYLAFSFDYKNLNLNWNNVGDLTRRGNKIIFSISILLTLILLYSLIALSYFATQKFNFSEHIFAVVYLVIIALLFVISYIKVNKNVFAKIND